MISDFANLVAILKDKKTGLTYIVSSILPRLVDHSATDDLIRKVNACLKDVMSADFNFKFICSYKAVVKYGTYRRYLFSQSGPRFAS